MAWSVDEIPDLTGQTMIVTGASSGIGLEAARVLAHRGAQVTLAVRDEGRGQSAARAIGAPTEVAQLDLADLASVRSFAARWREEHPDGLDVLVNNAGVMAIPRRETVDGFEMQLGTNHLGHFALTGLLLDALRPDARVVTVSSGVHRAGRIDFDDLQGRVSYNKWRAYAQSKLANLLFAQELHRRAQAAGSRVRSIAVHPGYAATNLQHVGPRMEGRQWTDRGMAVVNRLLGQSAAAGAWPTLMAATDPAVAGASFLGPTGLRGMRGAPGHEVPSAAARDEQVAQRLWQVSVALTGVDHPW